MKYCPKCGTQNGDEAKFCKSCGYSFAVATNRQHEKTGTGFIKPPPSYPPYPEQPGQSNRGRIFLLIAAVIVILGAGGFALWTFVLSKNATGPKSELENVDLGVGSSGSTPNASVNPAFEKFIGDWYSDNANIKRTRISAHGDLLLVVCDDRDNTAEQEPGVVVDDLHQFLAPEAFVAKIDYLYLGKLVVEVRYDFVALIEDDRLEFA